MLYRFLSTFIGRHFLAHLERHGYTFISTDHLAALRENTRLLTLGKCTCNCGRVVNNTWRDSDGYHCLTCLAKQRDDLREILRSQNIHI